MQMKLMELQNAMQSGFEQIQQAPAAQPEAPANDAMLKEMQALLGQIKDAKTNDSLEAIMAGIHGMMQHMGAPTEVVYGPNGKAVGMRKVPLNG